MWVYGDLTRRVSPDDLLAEVEADLAMGEPVSALIGLGQLAQGVADAELGERGCDARSPAVDALMMRLTEVAALLPSPREGEGLGMGRRQPHSAAFPESSATRLHPPIPTLPPPGGKGSVATEVRVPEGYAFYSLHPAVYAAAARQLPPGDWRVIGIRSIGTSLAAVVATALGAPPPVTVRPTGHPFARELRLSPELEAEWAAHKGPFVIVDEGPGLSGSSFGAVADALERLGAGCERIAFLPGHGGELGPQASDKHRARWADALRPLAGFDEEVMPALMRGVEALVGPATAPWRDLSGERWRELRAWAEPPPVAAGQERRKFLHQAAGGAWLVKFAGLGRIGAGKLRRAQALHAAGLAPEPVGLTHGFLVERWEEASPLESDAEVLDGLGDCLAFRAAAFPADEASGASATDLLEMTRANAAEALGPAAGEAVMALGLDPAALEGRMRRVHVDGRLHRWEWLRLPDGRILKADAVDHSQAHDLIGAQDIAWDVAGAEAEFDLSTDAVDRLRRRLNVDPVVLTLMRPAYSAFQLGLWTMAADAQADADAARARAQAGGYARRLAALLGVDPPAARV